MQYLYYYQELKTDINILKNDILFYEKLLSLEDISHLDYFSRLPNLGIKYISPIFSVVEKEVLTRETAHILNHKIVKEMLNNAKANLLQKENKIAKIDNIINSLSKENQYIAKCKILRMKYKDICVNFRERFRYQLEEQTIKLRVKNIENLISCKVGIISIKKHDYNLNYLL